MTHIQRRHHHPKPAATRPQARPAATTSQPQARPSAAAAPRPAARPVDTFESAPRRTEAPAARAPATRAPSTTGSQRKKQMDATVRRELERLPVSADARKRLEQTALHPGSGADERRAARDLRRVLYATRNLPPSTQAGMVQPFIQHPTGQEARAAASLTRRDDFRTAPTAQRELMARIFPSMNPAQVGNLAAATRQVSATPLSENQREQVLRNAFSRTREPQDRLATRDVLQALRNQAPETQAAVLRTFSSPQGLDIHANYAQELVRSPAWTGAGPAERQQLAQVFGAATSPTSHYAFDKLLKAPARLMDADATGRTLLSNLAALATGPLHASIPASRRAELLDGVIQETSRPRLVDQTRFGTCTVTSMQYELARDNPSEFARLVAGIASPAGQVEMRGGGTLELQADSLSRDALRERSFSETLFQSAAMEFANGEDDYQVLGGGDGPDGLDRSVRPNGTTYGGQYAEGMVRATSALFGRPFSAWFTTDANRPAQLDFLRNHRPDGPNSPVLISFDTNGAEEGGGHAVTFVRMEGDRVFFRNPWGPNGDARTGQEMPFGARMEDTGSGLYSFSLAQFQERVYGLTVPEEARAFGAPFAAA
jgi:hypothetical protein